LVVLDDLLKEAYSWDVFDLLTEDSYHRNISVTPNTQKLVPPGKTQ
jgi:hypothetical protein